MKKDKGITLVVLVITVIVMLILAGISVNMLIGENGIIEKTKIAKQENIKGQIKEELELQITDTNLQKITKNEEVSKQEIVDKLSEIGVIITNSDNGIVQGEYKNYEITIDKNYNVTVGEELTGEKPVGKIQILTQQEELEEVRLQVTANITKGKIEAIEALNGAVLLEEVSETEKIFKVTKNGTYKFRIVASNKRTAIESTKISNILTEYESVLMAVSNIKENSIERIKVKGKTSIGASEETVKYGLDVIYYNKDLILDGITPVIIDSETTIFPNENKTYEFGRNVDVATNSTNAQNTVILKVNGNLIIKEGVTLTSVVSSQGYGGPKGMIVYCSERLTNNGTISMTQRGAKAEGQNVYLWKNIGESYEYINKIGAAGGAGYELRTKNSNATGSKGLNGSLRGTGGGGAGGAINGDSTGYTIVIRGGNGTSYSGGTGSGAINCNNKTYTRGRAADDNGGTGGMGRAYRSETTWRAREAAGGVGNPGGIGGRNTSGSKDNSGNDISLKGNNGTGGLLIIWTSIFENNGLISSTGTDSVTVPGTVAGGASGGGSINIFYEKLQNRGEFNVSGGKSVSSGGAGGAGTVTMGRIENGTVIKE